MSAAIGSVISCDRNGSAEAVTLYTSIDQPISRPIIDAFTKKTGVKVTLVTDTEANKSVGLAERLRAEKDRPRCDVWWGNEPFHTINLANEGLFQPYDSPSADDVPAIYRDAQHRWTGNGLRARVLVHNIDRLPAHSVASVGLLGHPTFSNSATIARPTAGTTGGAIAAMYTTMPVDQADLLFRRMRHQSVKLLGGNAAVAESVADGTSAFGWTDNDDAAAVMARSPNVKMTLPDQGPLDSGTLMIPTTVALVAGRPENAAARKLIDYLLSKQVEQDLMKARFAGWSIRGGENQPKAMQINYEEVAKNMPNAVRRATAILEGREP